MCVCVCVFLPYLPGMQITFLHHTVLSSVMCLALSCFSTLSHENGTIFGKKLLDMKCVLILSTTSFCNLTYSEKNSARY